MTKGYQRGNQLLIAPLISFGHCVIRPSIYSFWLPLWYLLVIVLSVPPFIASDCPFGIFWSLCYLYLHLQLLIAHLVSFGHCVICPSSYSFWLPLWYPLVIVLSVPPVTASDCPFDIFWSLCYLSLHLQLLIAPLVSFGHCVICTSIYSFWLPLWYPLVIVLSVPPFTASDCPFDILWSLCYLSIQLQLLIAPFISFGHCVIGPSSYGFWLPLWYRLVIVLSVPPFTASDCPLWYPLVIVLSVPPFTASDCPFDIFWSLCYLSLQLQLLIAPLISFGHCVICPSSHSFWLPLWYPLVIVLSVPPFTASDCPFDIFWSLCYLSLHLQLLIAPLDIFWSLCYLSLHLQLLIAHLVSFGHCVICPSSYSFWLPLWYPLVIVLSVPPVTASDCPFDIFWSLCYLSLHLQLLIAPLVSFGHCVICTSIYSFWLPLWYPLVIVLSVPPFTASDCPFDIFWSLCYLVPPFTASDCPFDIVWSLCYLSLHLQLLIAPLISFGHCVIRPSINSFWLPLWYLLVIVLSVPPFTVSDCPFGIFWSLCYLYIHLQLLIAPLISFGHCVICPSIYSFWLPLCYLLVIVISVPPFTASDCPFAIFWSLCYPSLHYSFWLPFWYLLVIVLSVPPFTASYCPFEIVWSLCYLSLQLQLLIAPLKLFGHCVFCPSSYSFWLPLWYLLVIVLSVPPFTASDCPFDIFWSLCYPSLHLQLLIAPLISFGHCVIRPSIYSFWLPIWYLLVIVLSVPLFTSSDCPFDIFWSLCYPSLQLQLLIAPLISVGHCVIRSSSYSFWLPLWYLLVIVLSVPPFTASDCPFGIFWSLCYPSLQLRLLIAPLISFCHCVICPSIYSLWLPLWYLLVIVLSSLQLQLLIAPLVSFGHCVICPSIYSFWLPLWYLLVIVLSSLHLQLLIAPFVSFCHCVICASIYSFWLPLGYLLVIVLSVPPFTASDCPFEIVWSLCYLSIRLQFLNAPLISFGYCVIRPSIYSFWLPPWYLFIIVLSVPPFTASDCPFDIFSSLCYLSLHLQFLIAPLISFGHCVVRPSSYSFWLHLWYLLIIVLSVPPFTASDCPFDIFWSLCYLYPHLQLLIALWYLLVIVLSVPPFTASDCPFDIFWSLCYLYLQLQLLIAPFDIFWSLCYLSIQLRLLIAPLVSLGHCVICPSIYSFWLPLCYLLVIVLSVPPVDSFWLPLWYLLVIVLSVPPFTASDCPFDIFWSLCYPSLQLQLLIALLVSFGHCVICPSSYGFWLPLWYLLVIVLSVPPFTTCDCYFAIFWLLCYPSPFTASDCPCGIFWSLCYLSLQLQLLIAPLISFGHCVIRPSIYSFWLPLWYLLVIVLSVPPVTASDCPFDILWSLCYPSLHLQLLIAPLISFGHCVICTSIYSFWLPLWYLLVIVLSVPPFTASDCPFAIFWSLCYLYLNLQLLIAPLLSFGHCVVRPSIYSFWLPFWYLLVIVLSVPPFTASYCPFEIVWSLCYLSLQLQLLIAPLKLFGHCVFCPSSYSFWLPLWYLLVIVISVPPFTASDCPFDIFWSLCYPSLHLQLLIAPLISFGHCVIRPSIYSFWLPIWYLLVIVLSVPLFTSSDCPFDIFWSLCYPSLQLQLLIAPLISVGHCVIRSSSYSFWLPLWYLLVIVLSVPPFTASDCPFGIFWSLCYPSLQLRLLIAPLISFCHCVICPSIYSLWLPLWYLLVIVLSSLQLQLLIAPLVSFGHCVICPSIYSFWLPLWYLLVIVLSSLHLQLLIAPFVSFCHCVICASIYSFWLPLGYLLVIVLSVPPFTASDCPFEIVWSLCYLSIRLQFLNAPLISFGYCVIRPSIYSFWLPPWYLFIIVLSVPPFTASDCPFDIFSSLCYLSLHLQFLIAPLISFGHCVVRPSSYSFWLHLWYLLIIVLSVPPFTASDCPFDIFWSLCYLYPHLQLLIALWYLLVIVLSVPPFTASDCPLISFGHCVICTSSYNFWLPPLISFGHCVICPSSYGFWLPLWYLWVIVLSVPPFTASDCPFAIFWSLCYPSLHWQLLIAPLVSFGHCVIRTSIYSFWLPLWYLLVIVLSVPPVTASDCPFGIFWSLCYLSIQLRLLIAPLVSFGHCVICPSIYNLWLLLCYLLVIVLSVPPFTASDCPCGIFWSLCYLSLQLQLLIAPLISFGHCVIRPSIYSFWLPLWYLLVIVLSVPPVTASDCPFDILWSLCYPSLHLQLLIAPLISFGHCVICTSIYSFWLPLWYLLVNVLSVPPFTASDCPFDIFWSLCYLSLHLQLLIAPLVSFGHCVICTSIYSFWLPIWYILVIVLSVPPVTASDCPFDILWSLCYPSLHLQLLIAPLISFGHCVICTSIYSFWLPLWYLLVNVLSVPPFTASDCPFDIFWSLCYLYLQLQLLIAPLLSFGHCVICTSIYCFW